MDSRTDRIRVLNDCVAKLMDRVAAKQQEVRANELREGRGWDPRKASRLRRELDSLHQRLVRAERLQEEALSGKAN